MPLQEPVYGNLHAYKLYTRPTAHRLYGGISYRKKPRLKHHENVQRMLKILALSGPLTTWGMAKTQLYDDVEKIRIREKKYRKLLVGRDERNKHFSGILETGIVIREREKGKKGQSAVYRLSLHGILYCLDVLDLTNKEIDIMAEKYSDVLPYVFGKWDYLKSVLHSDVYRIRLIAKGIFLDNIKITGISKFPLYEILTFLFAKYQQYYEKISEKDLADQISYLYFTHLLVPSNLVSSSKQISIELQTWKALFSKDKKLKQWYQNFLDETSLFYEKRFDFIKKLQRL